MRCSTATASAATSRPPTWKCTGASRRGSLPAILKWAYPNGGFVNIPVANLVCQVLVRRLPVKPLEKRLGVEAPRWAAIGGCGAAPLARGIAGGADCGLMRQPRGRGLQAARSGLFIVSIGSRQTHAAVGWRRGGSPRARRGRPARDGGRSGIAIGGGGRRRFLLAGHNRRWYAAPAIRC